MDRATRSAAMLSSIPFIICAVAFIAAAFGAGN
jgi:hypothetical protein